ncbi:MAG TPA: hypothetical protein PK067_09510 [Kaistella chaponensis]|nr:hypothetical protein [Kaistella chaponensis]
MIRSFFLGAAHPDSYRDRFLENVVPLSIAISRSSFVVTAGFPLQSGLEVQAVCLSTFSNP